MMKRALIYSLAVCLMIGAIVSGALLFGQEPSDSATAVPVEDLRVRYAKACLQLAEVQLERAMALQSKFPGAGKTTRIEWLRGNVAVAEQQLEIAREYEHGSTMPLQAAYAEAAAKSAEKDFQSAKLVHARTPAAIPKLTLESLRLKAEVAQLRAELWRDPANLPSLLDQMQWQIDRLTETLIDVDQRVRVLE